MKEANFLKRLSAITLAAAITAANVGFDFLPTAKKAAAEPKEEKSVTEVTTPKVMTQKSKYPTSLSFIVEKNEIGESVLKASDPTVFNKYFTAEIVSLDQPAEGEEPEQLEFSADGTVIRAGGNYSVNVKARVNEETGELVYNPYRIVESAVKIDEPEEIPEAEAVDQEIAVLDEGEFVEEITEEAVSEELAEIVEVPELTEISLNICESNVNAAVGMFDMSQSQKLDYVVVKSQDSYNVMIPDDYTELFLNGIDEAGNGFFNAAGADVQVNFNEIEMNIQVVNFAELKIKDIAEPEDYSIERFCGEESLPYYYGEIIKVTPDAGYNIVVGDMKFSDAVSVEINNDAFGAEQDEIKVFEGEQESDNFVVREIEEDKFTVELGAGELSATKYTLSVPSKGNESRVSENKPLTFMLDEVESNDGVIRVDASKGDGISFIGFDTSIENYKEQAKADHFICDELGFPFSEINRNDENSAWFKDGCYTPYLSLDANYKDKVEINKFVIKTISGEELAVYDADCNLIAQKYNIADKNATLLEANQLVWNFPLNPDALNNVHEDLCLYVDYTKIMTFSFSATSENNQATNSDVEAFLNGKKFSELENQEVIKNTLYNKNNKVKFTSLNGWLIQSIKLNDGNEVKVDAKQNYEYNIGTADEVKKRGDHVFVVKLTSVQTNTVNVTLKCEADQINAIQSFNVTGTFNQATKNNVFGEVSNDKNYNCFDAEKPITLKVYPKVGYYVESIKKYVGNSDKAEVIYDVEKYTKAENPSFNIFKSCEVVYEDKTPSEGNVTYSVAFAAAANADDIKAVLDTENLSYGSYKQEGYNFSFISNIESCTFSFKKGDEELYFHDSVSQGNAAYSINKNNTSTINPKDIKESPVYYFLNGNKVEKVTLTINIITAYPIITKFEVADENLIGKVVHILTFGIFANKDFDLNVYANANNKSGLDYKISDIKLYNDNDTNNSLQGSDELQTNKNGEIYKTFTLSGDPEQYKQYNLTAQAFAKFDPNSKEGVENPQAGDLYTLDLVKYKISEKIIPVVAVNSETAIDPVIIETKAPTVTFTPITTTSDPENPDNQIKRADVYEGKTLWYGQGGAEVNVKAEDENGISELQYTISDGTKSETHTVDGDRTKVDNCTHNFSIAAKSGETLICKITATAYDNAGNEGKAEPVTVNIDACSPSIENVSAYLADENGIKLLDANGQPLKYDYTQENNWTNQNVIIEFTVTDDENGSGVNVKTIKANGKDVGVGSNGVYYYVVGENFAGDIELSAMDNVGNPAETKKIRVQTESHAPDVKSFKILAAHSYNQEISKDDLTNSFNAETFQYYFDINATVIVSAVDISNFENLNSGIKEITFAQIPSNEVPFENDITKYIVDSRKTDGDAEFAVNAGFEGTFAIQISDKAGNKSKWYTPEMLVAEDPIAHGDHSHAEIILPYTPYNNGNPLYAEVPNVAFYVNDPVSGIQNITYSISTNGNDKEENYPVGDLKDQTKKINVITSGTGEIKLSDYEANDITIKLKAYDNAGNEIIATTQIISIDKSAPELLSIKFNPEGSDKQEFFNKQRTATIRVKDRNLNTENLNELLDVTVTNALGTSAAPYKVTKKWEVVEPKTGEKLEPGEKVYECVITFVQDAEYSFTMSVEDLTKHSLKLDTYKFTIDTTAPTLSITFDNNSKANGKYYNAARKATLTINEHNFAKNKDTVKTVLSAKGADGITTMDSKEIYDGKLTWTQSSTNKDEWTAQVNFNKEGTFDFSMAYTDPAGNSGNNADSGEFVIDTTAPKIDQTFTKGGSKFATNGDLVPHVTFSDYNFLSENQIETNCKVTIKKIGSDGLSKKNFPATSRTYTAKNSDSPVTFEQVFDIFEKDIEVDGIYEIAIRAEDLAGNVTEKNDLTVSINRYGSTYMIVNEEARAAVEKYAIDGTPIKDNIKFEIAEVNVTPQKSKGVVNINVNNKTTELKDGVKISESRVLLEDNSWERNENGWYQTLYEIDKKKFAEDGTYTITLYSEDEAGNKNFSDSPKPPRESFAAMFAVDTTAPTIIISGTDEYDVDEVALTIICSDRNLYNIDNLSYDANNKEKSTFYIKINDDYYDVSALKSQLGAEITNDESGNMNIKMSLKSKGNDSEQNIDVFIRDKAGNSTIETDSFLPPKPNNWLMLILIAAGVIILGTAVFFVTKKVRSR